MELEDFKIQFLPSQFIFVTQEQNALLPMTQDGENVLYRTPLVISTRENLLSDMLDSARATPVLLFACTSSP